LTEIWIVVLACFRKYHDFIKLSFEIIYRHKEKFYTHRKRHYPPPNTRTLISALKASNPSKQGKRLLIKDMAQYFVPPNNGPVSIAPSLIAPRRGVGTESHASGSHLEVQSEVRTGDMGNQAVAKSTAGLPYPTEPERHNPTVVPTALLGQFHFAFLIRHPRKSIPSYYRCTIPPLDKVTGFYYFRPDEAGYDELRRTFDYLRSVEIVGPAVAGQADGSDGTQKPKRADICVIDADDLLDKPNEIIEAFCKSVGIDYSPDMLNWDRPEQKEYATEVFKKWNGFHEDAIHSTDLKPRKHVSFCAPGAKGL